MNWILFAILLVVAICLGYGTIRIAISAIAYDKAHYNYMRKNPGSWSSGSGFFIEIMAGYWTAVIVIGGIAVAFLTIAIISLMKW